MVDQPNKTTESVINEPIKNELIVLVHGIWMNAYLMGSMAKRLQAQGYDTAQFDYRFLRRSPIENAQKLCQFVERYPHPVVHFVGYSLGGIVVMHLLASKPFERLGKVVLLGSPVRGSTVAAKIMRIRGLHFVLGKSTQVGLLGGAPLQLNNTSVGVITGSKGFGLFAMLKWVKHSGDGVVSDSETMLLTETARTAIPESHVSLLYSKQCVQLIAAFLSTGQFTKRG